MEYYYFEPSGFYKEVNILRRFFEIKDAMDKIDNGLETLRDVRN